MECNIVSIGTYHGLLQQNVRPGHQQWGYIYFSFSDWYNLSDSNIDLLKSNGT